MTLEELRRKYGFAGGTYQPNPHCKFCGGAGERKSKSGEMRFCICLFVAPDMSNFAGEALAETVRKLRREMDGGR